MFELLVIGLFLWIAFHLTVFSVKAAWGLAKVVGMVLVLLAMPVMLVCLVFVGGVFLLLPLVLLGIAYAVLKCIA